ncbi:twin-arginine translocase TatA/TatE family subunit [Pseudomonas borbori]|uniref:Sec-independent protein translocase protein TatA n=1 Tax=Pseudomonas borbori TaxID=289003 RepID=A0A1I5LN41_9PSED|nr:twin-arginine translocase TatA/TatE family subunit [Pseudomonas borbori]SFO98728.1 sec-independent protein translocase protein TatA [Pseudomonas borbori]
MGIGGISIWQLLIILLIVVMLFGTKRLKGLGSDLGDAIKGFRKSMGNDDKPAVDEHKGQTIDAQARKVEQPSNKY